MATAPTVVLMVADEDDTVSISRLAVVCGVCALLATLFFDGDMLRPAVILYYLIHIAQRKWAP